ncbi:hypothetical protein J2129_002517 [Methanofollis sp. W23]|nr:hypothetical protein [Methanofollis sp. W23]
MSSSGGLLDAVAGDPGRWQGRVHVQGGGGVMDRSGFLGEWPCKYLYQSVLTSIPGAKTWGGDWLHLASVPKNWLCSVPRRCDFVHLPSLLRAGGLCERSWEVPHRRPPFSLVHGVHPMESLVMRRGGRRRLEWGLHRLSGLEKREITNHATKNFNFHPVFFRRVLTSCMILQT